MNDLKSKLLSRKFWLAAAAFLGSIGSTVAGTATDNQALASVGVVCAMLSAAIYAAAESYVDASAQKANVTYTEKNVSATASDRAIVAKTLGGDQNE